STGWNPIWSFYFFIYLIIVASGITIAPGLITSIMIYNRFKDTDLKKRWNYYLLGFCCTCFLMYAIMIANFSDFRPLREIVALFGVIFSILGGLLIYFGIGRML
ncbi:MAG: hypothetical protein ACFFAO_10590, partial [Candidatus Hermodarchaeota archaeon]